MSETQMPGRGQDWSRYETGDESFCQMWGVKVFMSVSSTWRSEEFSLGFQPGWQVFKGRPKSPKGGSGTWAAAVTRRRWLCRVYVGQPFDKQKQILGQKLGELNLYQLLWTFIMKIVSGDRMSAPSQNLRGKNPRLSFCVNLQSKAPTSRKGTGMFYSCV